MNRIRWIYLGIILVLAIGFFLFLGTEQYLEHRILDHIEQEYGSVFEVHTVDVGWISREIQLRDSHLQSDTTPVARVETIRIRPRLRSLFGDQWVIEEVLLEDITLMVEQTATGYNFQHTLQELNPEKIDGSSTAPGLVIKRLILLNAQLEYRSSNNSQNNLVRLSPIQAILSPVHVGGPTVPLEIRAVMKPDLDRPPLLLTGTVPFAESEPTFRGEFSLERFSLTHVSPVIPDPYRILSGEITGKLPFKVESGQFSLDPGKWTINGASIFYDGNRKIDDNNQPKPSGAGIPDTLQWDDLHIDMFETSFSYGSQSDSTTLRSDAGFLELPARSEAGDLLDMKGGFELIAPRGQLLYDLRIPLVENKPYHLVAEGKFPRVKDLNPILMTQTGFLFDGGSAQGATRGTFSADQLDLRVSLAFNNLKIQDRSERKLGLLQLPTSVVARYLANRDGSLEITFHVGGSPVEPVLDVSEIRRRVITGLGIDAAVIGALGLPFYVGDRALEKTTGISVFGEVSDRIGSVFKGSRSIRQHLHQDTGTAIRSPERKKR